MLEYSQQNTYYYVSARAAGGAENKEEIAYAAPES